VYLKNDRLAPTRRPCLKKSVLTVQALSYMGPALRPVSHSLVMTRC